MWNMNGACSMKTWMKVMKIWMRRWEYFVSRGAYKIIGDNGSSLSVFVIVFCAARLKTSQHCHCFSDDSSLKKMAHFRENCFSLGDFAFLKSSFFIFFCWNCAPFSPAPTAETSGRSAATPRAATPTYRPVWALRAATPPASSRTSSVPSCLTWSITKPMAPS